MSDFPTVSVITSTWHRPELLFERCIPSVQAQTYPAVEHVIVSDGPDPELYRKLLTLYPALHMPLITPDCLLEHNPYPHWGTYARLRGLEIAHGDLITYCDDDDALRSNHVELLAAALADHPEVGWAYSLMESHGRDASTVIGWDQPSCGSIGTPMLMHRRATLEHGTWGEPSDFEDWELVNRWIHAGIGYIRVDEVTIDVWPSIFHGPGR